MSVLYSCDNGWIISHLDFYNKIDVSSAGPEDKFKDKDNGKHSFRLSLDPNLFEIEEPFKDTIKVNGKVLKSFEELNVDDTTRTVKLLYDTFVEDPKFKEIFKCSTKEEDESTNKNDNIDKQKFWPRNNFKAVRTCQTFFETVKSLDLPKFLGANPLDEAVLTTLPNASSRDAETRTHRYLFPSNTKFYCNDVENLEQVFRDNDEEGFDLIVMDPPWWNKFIRRRKRHHQEAGYGMIDNDTIAKLPIQTILNDGGVIVVWCTNAKSHREKLIGEMFSQWGITHTNTFFWLKVTKAGQPVCPFNGENKKQPYETIIIGTKSIGRSNDLNITAKVNEAKIVISVPSSINSHKPPLIDIVKLLYPQKMFSRKLEIFARYLIPEFVSYGNEVVKLQHESLYVTSYC